MMTKEIEVFLPPSVQVQIVAELGFLRLWFDHETAREINALWKERNQCTEERIAEIDDQMLKLVLSYYENHP